MSKICTLFATMKLLAIGLCTDAQVTLSVTVVVAVVVALVVAVVVVAVVVNTIALGRN
jgi:hypothetical protein